MTNISTSATITSDIDFFQSENSTYSTAFRNLQGGIGYKVGITGGSGAGYSQADAIYNLAGYVIPSGSVREYDFKSLPQEAVGSSYVLSMTGIKALVIRNHNTGVNEALRLRATGLGFSGLFHGQAGDVRIEPQGVYMYTNPIFGLSVPSGASFIQIHNIGSGAPSPTPTYNTGIAISIVAVGISGTGG